MRPFLKNNCFVLILAIKKYFVMVTNLLAYHMVLLFLLSRGSPEQNSCKMKCKNITVIRDPMCCKSKVVVFVFLLQELQVWNKSFKMGTCVPQFGHWAKNGGS